MKISLTAPLLAAALACSVTASAATGSTHGTASKDSAYWVEKLGLKPHPEGGFFKRMITADSVRTTHQGTQRADFSSIHFLLEHKNSSHFHQLKSDEVWYYHAGSPLTVHVIDDTGEYKRIRIGPNIDKGEVLSAVVKAGWIFGATVEDENGFALVSCMVAPAFDMADFKLFTQAELLSKYPQHKDIIKRLAFEHLPQ